MGELVGSLCPIYEYRGEALHVVGLLFISDGIRFLFPYFVFLFISYGTRIFLFLYYKKLTKILQHVGPPLYISH